MNMMDGRKRRHNPLRVVAMIHMQEDKLFVARRKKYKKNGGQWEFPGGKMRGGETIFQALTREISEEFGFNFIPDCELGRVIHVMDSYTVIELIAIKGSVTGKIQYMTDHDAVEWVSVNEMSGLPNLSPADQKLWHVILPKLNGELTDDNS